MALQLVNSAAVVAAHHFNPSVATQLWLVDNNIVLREEFVSGAVFTDMFVQVPTRDFLLLIVPDNCQFTLAPHVQRQQELAIERVGRLVTILPHTPYKAVGINFIWHLVPENNTIDEVCRRLFYDAGNPLHRLFDVNGARFGCYLSKDSLGCRLKLNVQPVMIAMPDEPPRHLIQFVFNYHLDLAGRQNPVAEIGSMLNRWNEAHAESSHIVDVATGGQTL